MKQRRLYGRSDLIDRLARSEAALVLLTGDSGVGKSEVLRAASAPRAGWFSAPPCRLSASAGALQNAVLQGMADIVVQVVEERGHLVELANRLSGATQRMASSMVRELGRVAAAELLALVRGRLGEDVGKALTQFVNGLREEMSEALEARLYAAVDASMAETLAAFAGEVGAVVGDRQLSLSLDAGERLDEDERRLLVDLAERLPANYHLRIGLATDTPARRAAASEIVILGTGIHEIEIPPLDARAIAAWLADEGLGDADVAAVGRATGGYPLHLDDLMRHLKTGGFLSEAPPNEQAMRRVQESWRQLPTDAARAARALCVLPDPLPETRLIELTGLQPPAYGHVVQQLQWARFFPLTVNGQPWFHEQRREFVLRQLLPAEKDTAYSRAATVVWQEVLARNDFHYVDLFSRLTEDATVLHRQDPRLGAVVRASEEELAVLAALLELMVPQQNGATDGQELVRHARRFTAGEIDPPNVLTRLEQVGLIVWARNDHAAVVLPSWTAFAAAAVHGRAARLLRRTPVPELASLAYEVGLRPLLGKFTTMHLGVGTPSLASLSRLASGTDPDPPAFRIRSVRRDLPPSLLIRARLAGRPLHAAVRYEDAISRDAAAGAVAGATADIFGEAFEIIEAQPYPLESVPTNRFVRAAERAFEARRGHILDSGDIQVPLSEPIAYDRAMELRVETVRLMRERSSGVEQEAASIVEPYAIYWDEADDAWIECLVRGGVEEAARVPGLASSSGDPAFNFFSLEQAIALPDEARIDRLVYGGGPRTADDPVFIELANRRRQAALFNSAQPRLHFVLEKDGLERFVRDGFLRQMADARALQAVAARHVDPLPATALYVLVILDEPTSGWVAGAGARVSTVERVSDSCEDEVHFELIQGRTDLQRGFGPTAVPPRDNLFGETFGFSDGFGASRESPDFLNASQGGLDLLLSRYVGFDHGDVELRWPGEDF